MRHFSSAVKGRFGNAHCAAGIIIDEGRYFACKHILQNALGSGTCAVPFKRSEDEASGLLSACWSGSNGFPWRGKLPVAAACTVEFARLIPAAPAASCPCFAIRKRVTSIGAPVCTGAGNGAGSKEGEMGV